MRVPARLLLLLLVTGYLLLVVPSALAQSPNPYTAPNTNPDVPKNLHTYTQNVVIELMAAAACQLTGIDPINTNTNGTNGQCLGFNPTTGKIGFVDPSTGSGGGGAVGLMGNLIAMTYNIPLSGGDYTKYLASNFGLAKPAYAQGVGFQGLQPLIRVWSAFRNIVYLLLVVVFVIVGLAIMLRVKIDPRTVMTIQNQIPKIVIVLILITFSFAIAGLLIDLMWVAIYLIVGIISQVSPTELGAHMTNLARASDPFNAANIAGKPTFAGFGAIIGEPVNSVGGIVLQLFDNPPGKIIIAILTGAIGAFAGGGIQKVIQKTLEAIPFAGGAIGAVGGIAIAGLIGQHLASAVGSVIAFLVIGLAVLWALFRLWIALIFAYVYILIDAVLAPFWILAGLIPGSAISFGSWLRHILANIIAFPATIAMFLLGMVFINAFGTPSSQEQFLPPLIGNPSSTHAIGALIGLGIILMTPQVVNMLKEALKSPELKYTTAIGQAVGVGGGITSSIYSGATSPYGALAAFARWRTGEAQSTLLGAMLSGFRRPPPPPWVEQITKIAQALQAKAPKTQESPPQQ